MNWNVVMDAPCTYLSDRAKLREFKGTLMQIWKSAYVLVFIWKQYPENFAFLIIRIIELFTCEVCKFLKK